MTSRKIRIERTILETIEVTIEATGDDFEDVEAAMGAAADADASQWARIEQETGQTGAQDVETGEWLAD